MRTIIPLNQNWFYKSNFSMEDTKTSSANDSFEKVCLPHTNIELPYNYFDDESYRFVSCYKHSLSPESHWEGQRIFLDFEGVMNYARVYMNGTLAGEHKGGYTPFSIEITNLIDFTKENEITIAVDSTERTDTPPFGGQIDYLTYGGIYREVQLRIVSSVHINNMFVTTPNVLSPEKQLAAEVYLNGIDYKISADFEITLALYNENSKISSFTKSIQSKDSILFQINSLKDIQMWTLEHPKLYHVVCTLCQNKKEIDRYQTAIGFREAKFASDGFYLNGEKLKLTGLNRHQSYPYVGYAMPARVQKKDADILKSELGLNIVRTSHYLQSRHFLDRCDEIGLLVFEEIPGWQHIGDEEWQQQAIEDVRQMIVNDRNHPSIVIWGVRINESGDHHSLYTRTNELARKLDPTRATGGVRFLCDSEFLEDVYTMNDFIHDNGYGKYLSSVIRNYVTYDHLQDQDGEKIALREPKSVTGLAENVPYLVTEYNGHMYPTKRCDQEERTVEHALRHARVQNASHDNPNISGAIGWCAFDYNTHADFGSGDKICYHGVMDMFRIPKFAAYLYKSQKSPEQEIILEPATYWARGERNVGGVIPLTLFTNCDEVEFYYGENSLGTYKPDRKHYPALSHPPVVVDDMLGEWGAHWEDGAFVGYINGKEVIRKKYSRNPIPAKLSLFPDDTTLNTGDWDATRIVVGVKDQFGNPMPFFQEVIHVHIEGVGALIGPSQLALIGGQIAFWVKTEGSAGNISISVSCPRLAAEEKICIIVGE